MGLFRLGSLRAVLLRKSLAQAYKISPNLLLSDKGPAPTPTFLVLGKMLQKLYLAEEKHRNTLSLRLANPHFVLVGMLK